MIESIRRHRRTLHRMPEIGFELYKTQAYVLSILSHTSAKIKSIARTGVLAYFDAGANSTIAFRTDMDALEIVENTGASYASEIQGCMHACGHDGHMAVMLAFAEWLDGKSPSLKKNVLLIFEPAEETTGGGREIVAAGTLEEYNVDEIYAIHVDPELPVGALASRPGALMAQSCEVHISILGKSAHVARAEEGIDSLYVAVSLLTDMYNMEASMPAEVERLLKFGMLHSGTAVNVISERAEIGGTVRAFDEDIHAQMCQSIRRICVNCEEKYGVTIQLRLGDGYPPVINDAALFAKVQTALTGMNFQTLPRPSLLAEDFSFFTRKVPGLMLKIGVGSSFGLHSDQFIFGEEALLPALQAYKRIIIAG